jgi:hypothetical protein
MKLFAFLSRRLGLLKRLTLLPHLLEALLTAFTAITRPSLYRRIVRLREEVRTWPSVSERVHRYGGIQFDCSGRELGHVHGNGVVDLSFRRAVCDELVSTGRALPHHTLPDSGWVTVPLRYDEDREVAVALFRLAYSRAIEATR